MTKCPSCRMFFDYPPKSCLNCGYQFGSDPRVNLESQRWSNLAWVLLALGLLVPVIIFVALPSGDRQHPRSTTAEGTSLTSGSGTPADQPASSSSSTVKGLSANLLLAEQAGKNRETMQALTDAKNRKDYRAFIQILNLRSIELAQAINKVNTGAYSISDKQKMLNVLEQEKNWADSNAVALSQP